MQPTQARVEQLTPEDENAASNSQTFPPVSLKMARNFYVTDTVLETPPTGLAPAAYDKADPTDFLASFNGLGAVSEGIRDLLPADCRSAFDNAVEHENEWKSRWGLEKDTTCRQEPIIDKAIVP